MVSTDAGRKRFVLGDITVYTCICIKKEHGKVQHNWAWDHNAFKRTTGTKDC